MADTTPTRSSTPPGPADGCPVWAQALILRIRQIEIELGNLRPQGDAKSEWSDASIAAVMKRAFGDASDTVANDATAESLFAKVARGLTEEGFEPDAIAAFVNARVNDGGRLMYCDAGEVEDALEE